MVDGSEITMEPLDDAIDHRLVGGSSHHDLRRYADRLGLDADVFDGLTLECRSFVSMAALIRSRAALVEGLSRSHE